MSSSGAKVIVHRQDEYPFIEDVGTEIETAMATSIGMHLVRARSGFRGRREGHGLCAGAAKEVPLSGRSVIFSRGYPAVAPWATAAATLKAVWVSPCGRAQTGRNGRSLPCAKDRHQHLWSFLASGPPSTLVGNVNRVA